MYDKVERNLFRILISSIIKIIKIRGKNKSLLVPIDNFMSVLRAKTFVTCPSCKNKMNRALNFKLLNESSVECPNCGIKIYTSLMAIFLN